MSSSARSSRWPRVRRARSRSSRDLGGPLVEQAARVGQHRPGAQRVEAGLLAGQPAAEHRAGAGAGRRRRAAAPRRRRGRPAWRRRSAWRRGRRRPGRAAAGPARGRSPRRPACAAGATARTSASSENGSRSSTEPPPRATTITSTSGCRSSRASASITSAAARWPCMVAWATSKATLGQRRRAFSSTSRSAADSGRGDQPDPAGQERQRPLQLAGEQPLGGQQLAAPLEPGQQLAEADHPDLADRQRERAAVGVVGRLGQHHHAGALDQRRREAVDDARAGR